MRSRLCFLLFGSVLSASVLSAADWPGWRGPRRDGISNETGLLRSWPEKGPPLVWDSKTVNGKKADIGTGWSSISVANGRIFTMGDQGSSCHVYALDEKTGKILWDTKIGGTRGNGGPRCTPTVDGNRVYALSNNGTLACLDAAKGDLLWSKDYVKDFGGKYMASWYFCESPLVDGDKLICTPGAEDAGMVALDKETGNVLWKSTITKSGGCGYSSPVVAEVGGIRMYLTLMGRGRGLVGVDAKTGKLLWNYQRIANGTGNIPTPIVQGDLVFASTGYGTGAALLQLVPENGGIQVVERYFLNGNTLQNHHGQMVLVDGHVYGGHGHNNGLPFCLDLKTGKFAWGPERGPGQRSAAIACADGHVYFRWEDNILGLVEATPKGYNLKSSFQLPGGLGTGWPQPVIANGKLYIRGRGQLLCYDISAK